jgi:hypothetical protein
MPVVLVSHIAKGSLMNERATIQRWARTAAILMLVSMVAGSIGEAWIPSKILVSGDAAATARNIRDLNVLFRIGFATYMVEALCDITLALIFYVLLRPVQRDLALLAAFVGLVGTTLFAVAEMFYFAPTLLMGSGAYLKAFTPEQLDALTQLSLRFYSLGGMLFTAFYGTVWLIRSYLIYRSGYLPRILGVLMALGGLGFVLRNIALVLAPAYVSDVFLMLMAPGGLALAVWLLVKGVDVARWEARAARLPAVHEDTDGTEG